MEHILCVPFMKVFLHSLQMMKRAKPIGECVVSDSKVNVEILEVNSQSLKKKFILFPFKLYRNDPYWIPPLIIEQKKLFDEKTHPFFKHSKVKFYLAMKDGKVCGRIAGIINYNHIEFHNEKVGFFGFFECIDDFEVAKVLFTTVADFLKQNGMEIMRGPANYSTNEECGLLVEGFDSSPFVMMSYNKKYYINLIEQFGFEKAKDLYAYYMYDQGIPERLDKIAQLVMKRNKDVVIRSVQMKDLKSEIEKIRVIYNSAWSKNWGFIPMTNDEFDYMAKSLKEIIDPEVALIAEVNGNPVGFSLAVPNVNIILKHLNGRLFPFGFIKFLLNKKKINGVRIITLGVIEEYRNKGLDSLLYYYSYKKGTAHGYNHTETSWILEDNYPMNKAMIAIGAKHYKTYRFYDYKL